MTKKYTGTDAPLFDKRLEPLAYDEHIDKTLSLIEDRESVHNRVIDNMMLSLPSKHIKSVEPWPMDEETKQILRDGGWVETTPDPSEKTLGELAYPERRTPTVYWEEPIIPRWLQWTSNILRWGLTGLIWFIAAGCVLLIIAEMVPE